MPVYTFMKLYLPVLNLYDFTLRFRGGGSSRDIASDRREAL